MEKVPKLMSSFCANILHSKNHCPPNFFFFVLAGSPDRKLELLFDMFDFSGNGMVARKEITQVVR